MREILKLRIKEFAVASKMIRGEELKTPGWKPGVNSIASTHARSKRFRLYNYRVNEVRKRTRALMLVYGFLRGKAYNQIEKHSTNDPHWPFVFYYLATHTDPNKKQETLSDFVEWLDNAKLPTRMPSLCIMLKVFVTPPIFPTNSW